VSAWNTLAQLGLVLQQLDHKRRELNTCIAAHTGDLVCELAIIDVSGGVPAAARDAFLWDLSGSQPAQIVTAPVQGTSFAFAGPIPAGPIAITVTADDVAPSTGPVFRSGATPAPAVGASLRAEVVIGPMVHLTAEDISKWFSEIAAIPQHIDASPVGSFEVRLTSVAVTCAPSIVSLAGVGTVSGAMGLAESPFTASLDLALVPSKAPDGQIPAELSLVAPPHVQIAGRGALLGAALDMALSTGFSALVLQQVRDVVGREFAAGVARALALIHLPAGVLVSTRSLMVDSSGATFQPTLSCLGNVLSTFHPPANLVITP
jgi:hypothetical protein